ncbi:MAG: type III pantothenate kinase [Rhodothermales bacterium]|jgi:type III pantothenate kinase
MRLLNIGNTTAEIGTLSPTGEIVNVLRMPSAEIANLVPELSRQKVTVASVVPELTGLLELAIPDLTVVTAESAKSVDFSAVDCATLGADRVANALAAAALLSLPAIIVDCGTAITFEVISADARFLGGAILPGRSLAVSALHSGTAQLPGIGLSAVIPAALGTDTVTAISAGIGIGTIGAVREILGALGPAAGGAYATGGDADYFCDNLPQLQRAPANFTLRGIAEFAAS